MSTITKNLGRVSIVPKGEWNSDSTYTRLDLVTYNGSSYIAKQDVPTNIELSNDEYWMAIAKKGDLGDPLVFIAIYNQTTFNEISEALAAGKIIMAYDKNQLGSRNYCGLASYFFGADSWGNLQQYQFTQFYVDNNKKYLYTMYCSLRGNTTSWSNTEYEIEIAEEEFKAYVDTTIDNLHLQNLSQLEYEVVT